MFAYREEDPEDSVPHGHITSLVCTHWISLRCIYVHIVILLLRWVRSSSREMIQALLICCWLIKDKYFTVNWLCAIVLCMFVIVTLEICYKKHLAVEAASNKTDFQFTMFNLLSMFIIIYYFNCKAVHDLSVSSHTISMNCII